MRVVAVISGHVQGVGFRWFVRQRATAAGVAGSARNRADGRVEVVLEGPADAVRAVVDALNGSEAPGRVSAIDRRDDPVQGVSGFSVT